MLSGFSLGFCFFVKQKPAYEMRISDWSSYVCSSDLAIPARTIDARRRLGAWEFRRFSRRPPGCREPRVDPCAPRGSALAGGNLRSASCALLQSGGRAVSPFEPCPAAPARSEEHTSELQSLMRISYAVFCLKKKTQHKEIM